MTLSSNNPPRRPMNSRNADSTSGVDGSIPVDVRTRAGRRKRAARRLKATLALATLSLALVALPGQAFAHHHPCGQAAKDSTEGQYCSPVQALQAGLGAGASGAPAKKVAVPAASSGPSLPFTGLDVAALAVVALALTGTGIVLRRLATMGDSEK